MCEFIYNILIFKITMGGRGVGVDRAKKDSTTVRTCNTNTQKASCMRACSINITTRY